MKKKMLAAFTAMTMLLQPMMPAGTALAAPQEISKVEVTSVTNKDETVINVLDYGAMPGGRQDSTVPVQKALEAAKVVDGPVRLYFPKGEYHFYKDFASTREWHTSNTSSLSNPTKWIGFLIEEQEDLTVDGGGSTFMMHGDIMALAVAKSKNITLKNFVLDYEVPDTMDITVAGKGVTSDGKNYTDIYVPANYHYQISEDKKHIDWYSEVSPFTGKRYWQDRDTFGGYLVIYKGYDETVRRHYTNTTYEGASVNDADPFVGVDNLQKMDNNIVRFTYKNRVPNDQEVGNVYLLCNSARRRTCGAFIWESENTLVTDIDVHYLSGFGWLTQMSSNTEFNTVNFLPRQGTGKYTTSNADQIHVSGAGGYFNVINCNFSMAHDDPINIHGTYLRVEEVIDNQTLKLKYIHGQQGGFPAYFPGDQVMFYSRLNLEVPTGAGSEETFEVESVVDPGEEYGDGKLSMRETVVRFNKPFSEDVKKSLEVKIRRGSDPEDNTQALEPLYVAENVTYAATVLVKGNIMRSIPTRGILCTTRNEVIIEDNVFESLAMASLYLSNDADYWYESGPIRNMTIRNNTFNVRPTGQTEWATVSPIFVDPVIVNQAVAAPGYELPAVKGDPVHKNIVVEDNVFNMRAFNLVTAKGVDGFTFRNNEIYRDTMNLDLSLTSDKTSLQVGESATLHGSVAEDLLESHAFVFENCKNIVIENNSYDDGMNMNVKLNGSMTQDNVTITKDPLTIGNTSNVVSSESKVQYISLDPSIVKIESNGKATAVGQGTASVLAYCRWKNSIVRSEIIEITVSGSLPQGSITIGGAEGPITTVNGTLELTAQLQGITGDVSWSVVDAFTNQATAAATISSTGVLTGVKDGVVKVIASVGAITTEKLFVISLPDSYGTGGGSNSLVSEVSIVDENASNWKGTGEEDGIRIIGEMGDLYTDMNTAKNIVTYAIPTDIPKDDLRVQVTVDGLPKQGDNYNAAGLLLFNDKDNYIRVGTKGHMGNGIATDNEMNGGDTEEVKGSALLGRKAVFEIQRIGTTTSMRYKDLAAGSDWSDYFEIATSDSLGDNFRIGFCAWNKNAVDITAEFSGLKIGKASEVTTAQLEAQAPKALFNASANAAPTVTNCQVTEGLVVGDTATVTFDYSDTDNHAQGSVLYQWSNGTTNTYTTDPELVVREAGTYTCTVYVADEYRKPCQTPGTVSFTVENDVQADLQVTGLEINGNTVLDFKSEVLEYEYAYPIESDKAYINVICKNQLHGTVSMNDSAGNALPGQGELITLPEDGIVKIVRTGSDSETPVEYTIHFKAYDVNDSGISNISIANKDCQLIKEGANGYFVAINNSDNVVPLTFDVDAGVKSVRVTRSFYNTEIPGTLTGTSYTTEDVDLYSGLNIFHAFVEAADSSITEHVIQVFRSGYSDCDAQSIKLNGALLPEFDTNKLRYMIHMQESEVSNLSLEVETEAGKDITTSIVYDKERVEGSTLDITSIPPGMHTILVTTVAENLWTEKEYEIAIIVEEDSNNNLLSLESNVTIDQAFDQDVTQYTAKTTQSQATINVVAQHREARVYIESLGKTDSGVCSVESDITLYEGDNDVVIRVVAPDLTEKVYNLCITANGYVYLSDVEAEKITNGYGSMQYDASNSGGKIMVPDENGSPITYEKGLGGHASSEFIYNIQGMGYTSFEAIVGIDYVQYGSDQSSVEFKVYFDDKTTPEWTSGTMESTTPAKAISLDLTGVNKIRLVADDMGVNYNDHADWADAKFIKPLASAPTNPDPIEVSEVRISSSSASIEVGATTTLSAEVLPANAADKEVEWTSADLAIATVSQNGVVTAVKAGTTTITVASKSNPDKKATCTVTVTEPITTVPATSVTVDATASIQVGGTKQLAPVLTPSNTTDTCTYVSNDITIATVSFEGLIAAVAPGNTTITVTTTSGQTATCSVTVTSQSSGGNTPPVIVPPVIVPPVDDPDDEKPDVTDPITVEATFAVKNTKIATLSWTKKAKATQYVVYQKTGKGSYKKIATVGAKKTSYKVTGLKMNKTYKFKIEAKVNNKAVKVAVKVANSKKIVAKWTDVSVFTSYIVEEKSGSGEWKQVLTTDKGETITYTKKKAGIKKEFEFRLIGVSGEGDQAVHTVFKNKEA